MLARQHAKNPYAESDGYARSAASPAAMAASFEGMRVLFIEDDAAVRQAGAQALQLVGLDVQALDSAEPACELIRPDFPGVVVTDVRLPGMSGLDLLQFSQTHAADVAVILITGHGDISMAVQAMRTGAYDFIEKPFSSDTLVDAVTRAMERRRLALENQALRRKLDDLQIPDSKIIGHSPAIDKVRSLIASVASSDAPVLIAGETGTGKELVARSLHEKSARRDKPFVALNCGALPDTLFESEMFGTEAGAFTGAGKRRIGKLEYAHGGTLFLDEIESMPLSMQVKLLRALQEGTIERLGSNESIAIDVRVVAAVKGDLLALSNEGRFRSDLYYRLNVVVIDLPPLRARREDIPVLFEHFMLKAAVRYGSAARLPSSLLMQQLISHDWPGNVRELSNAADRFVLGVTDERLFKQDEMPASRELPRQMENVERTLILLELRRHGGLVSRAAEALGIPKTTLYDKIKKHRLGPELQQDPAA
jgi:two-component system, NtrC family, C4-dicarboxylate transport response regulator DctD